MTELITLKGIGEKTAAAFNRLGIFCAEDLVYYYPRDYERFEEPSPIYALTLGTVMCVEGVLDKDAVVNRYNGMVIVNAYLADMTGRLQLSWFNSPFIKNSLRAGSHLIFRGRVTEKNGRLLMTQPKIYMPETYHEKYSGRMMPVYPLTKGISNKTVMNAVAESLNLFARGTEFLPDEVIEAYNLSPMDSSLIRLHFPRSEAELESARKREVFNEFFLKILAGRKLSDSAGRSISTHKCRPDLRMIRFMAELPFELTAAQTRAYREITADMNSGHSMNRLIEGDVGSGKTIVALLAALNAALSGFQAAFMAPTAVLAAQHYDNFNNLLQRYNENADESFKINVNAVLLTGNLSQADKNEALRKIREHEADVIIGTHSLFQQKVEYADLGLIITDEQHRFGVGQREAIFNKGNLPHTLVMSATPIPRTLSIILYSGMDISVIDTKPVGRLPIKNAIVDTGYRKKAYKFILDEVAKGRQAYIICPAIENAADDNEIQSGRTDKNLQNVNDYARAFDKAYGSRVRTAILHGRMKNAEKDAVMKAFKEHETDVLISTTVVEVGVDVPNATVMMIENAERFGLAELHQLRGRVGRGEHQSYCIMINCSDSEKAAERLSVLSSTNDGFKIAEEDLRFRGPGDMFGIKQSGDAEYKLADIYRDAGILKTAKAAVDGILSRDPELDRTEDLKLKKLLSKYMETGMIL